jgi:hypothetical protein
MEGRDYQQFKIICPTCAAARDGVGDREERKLTFQKNIKKGGARGLICKFSKE